MAKSITTKVKVGDIIVPHSNSNSHSYVLGKPYKVSSISGQNYICSDENGTIGNYITQKDFKLLEKNKEYFETTINQLEKEIQKNKNILNWMIETGIERYTEDSYKIWEALTVLENKQMSKAEKVKVISSLLS